MKKNKALQQLKYTIKEKPYKDFTIDHSPFTN